MGYLGLGFVVLVCTLYVRRGLWLWRKRVGKSNRGFYPSGAALGNALQTLQAIAQPRAQHVITERLEEPTDEDDEGAPKDPTAHLIRQAKRIRSGEHVDRLTALLPPQGASLVSVDVSFPTRKITNDAKCEVCGGVRRSCVRGSGCGGGAGAAGECSGAGGAAAVGGRDFDD